MCKKGHLVVWAKGNNFGYWPAKVLSIIGNSVLVRFFGDYTVAHVDKKACVLFSESPPDSGNQAETYKNGLEVSTIFFPIKRHD